MKKLLATITASAMLVATSGVAFAAPFNAADKNPNIVAYYPDGPHGIVGFDGNFIGQDLVMKRGNSGNFQQWFYGTNPEGETLGIHSVWNVSKDGTCQDSWILVKNAFPDWGNYFQQNTDYCVHNNIFHPGK